MSKLARRRLLFVMVLGVAVAALTGCYAPLESAGKTARIQLVSSTTDSGYRLDYYRNLDYPCSISGYQTFVIANKLGTADSATRPLWTRMRGGGVGYFDAGGQPKPGVTNKVEESAESLIGFISEPGLMRLVRGELAGFRLLSVSMCNHDIYSGGDQLDPDNPNRQPDGRPRTVNGLFATKAAIQFARSRYPTSKAFLHGTSAGSYGSFSVAWSLERQGVRLAGSVADAGVLNSKWEQAQVDQNLCPFQGRSQTALDAVKARTHPELTGTPANEPDDLIRRGALTVPIMFVWSRADSNTCGTTPMSCPLPDGSTRTLGSSDCRQEPVRAAIAAQGPGSRSRNLRLCVSPPSDPGSCSQHVATTYNRSNTDPAEAADYNNTIVQWVRARLAD